MKYKYKIKLISIVSTILLFVFFPPIQVGFGRACDAGFGRGLFPYGSQCIPQWQLMLTLIVEFLIAVGVIYFVILNIIKVVKK